MIGTHYLINQINSLINSNLLSDLDLVQLSVAVDSIETKGVVSVGSRGQLPTATANKGRLIYIQDIQRYAYSNGSFWFVTDVVRAYSWGSNNWGHLGDATTTNRSSPVSIVGGFTDWVQISAGMEHSAGIRANGTAWAWGRQGNDGRLGDNTITNRSSPVSVVGGFTDWIEIGAGRLHTAAIRANGTAWAWGANYVYATVSGLLGDNTITNRSSPVSVVGGFTDWIQISVGAYHTAALRSNGTAWAWGSNGSGRLGDGTLTDRSSPVSVVGGFTNWAQISAGNEHTAAIRANGTAWAWGNGTSGRLGNASTGTTNSPVSVVGGFTDWVQISAGGFHTAAVRANGTAWAWGRNDRTGYGTNGGMLGDNTVVDRSSPVSVVGGFTDWVQVDAGLNLHTAGVRANGTAWAWGYNAQGQIGDGTTSERSSPVSVVGGFTDWVQISCGHFHTMGIAS